MNRLRALLKRPKDSSSILGEATTIVTPLQNDPEPNFPPGPWQAHLPCVHAPRHGCKRHNPRNHDIFFDASLFPEKDKGKVGKVMKKRLGGDIPEEYSIPEVHMGEDVPKWTELLPRVHCEVPWDLGYYHVKWLSHNPPTNTLESIASSPLHCIATLPSTNPPLTLVTRTLVIQSRVLLQTYFCFPLAELDLGPAWSNGRVPPPGVFSRTFAKNAFIGRGFQEFYPCVHTKLSFTSQWALGKKRIRTDGVNFTLRTADGKKVKREWSSAEPKLSTLCCTRCYTDTVVEIESVIYPDGNRGLLVGIDITKDLGTGREPWEQEWIAQVEGKFTWAIKRSEEDFLRMKREFEKAGDEIEIAQKEMREWETQKEKNEVGNKEQQSIGEKAKGEKGQEEEKQKDKRGEGVRRAGGNGE